MKSVKCRTWEAQVGIEPTLSRTWGCDLRYVVYHNVRVIALTIGFFYRNSASRHVFAICQAVLAPHVVSLTWYRYKANLEIKN